MNGFNKTEAAFFQYRLSFLRAFTFLSLFRDKCNKTKYTEKINKCYKARPLEITLN